MLLDPQTQSDAPGGIGPPTTTPPHDPEGQALDAALRALTATPVAASPADFARWFLPAGPVALPPVHPRVWMPGLDTPHTLATPGNFILLTGKAKSGKSGVMGALLAAAIAPAGDVLDSLGLQVAPRPEGHNVLHIDCEQGPYEYRKYIRSILKRTALQDRLPAHFHTASIREMPIQDRLAFLEASLERLAPLHLVCLDGISDFLYSVNDEQAAVEVWERVMRMAARYNTVIVSVLHDNQKLASGTGARGWLGSQGERKCQSVLSIQREGGSGICRIEVPIARSAGLVPTFEFSYCADREMFCSLGIQDAKGVSSSKLTNRDRIAQMSATELGSLALDAFGTATELKYGPLWQALKERTGLGDNAVKQNLLPRMLDERAILRDDNTQTYTLPPATPPGLAF